MGGKSAVLAVKALFDGTQAARGMQDVETRAGRMGRATQKAGRIAAVGLLALGAAAFSASKAAASDQAAQVNLANSIQKSTGASKAQIAQTEKWIDRTARATGVADDELRPALDKLVGSTKSVQQSQKALALAMDISARTGKPLQTVSAALAKGYGGNTTALGRLVPGISKAALASKDMTRITGELAKMTGGAAAKAADTAAGKNARMRVAFGELQEQIGAGLLPILSTLATILGSVASWVQNNSTLAGVLALSIVGLTAGIYAASVAMRIYSAVTAFQALQTKRAAAGQWTLNAAMLANPIGIVVLAIVALAAGFVVAYKKSATFRAIVQATGRAGQAALGWIVDKAKAAGTWIGKIGPAAKKGKDIFVAAVKLYLKPVQLVIDLVEKLVGWIKKIKFPKPPKWVSKIPGLGGLGGEGGPDKPHAPGGGVPGHGRGGPGGSGGWMTAGGSSSGAVILMPVNFNGIVGDPVAISDNLAELLMRRLRRKGL